MYKLSTSESDEATRTGLLEVIVVRAVALDEHVTALFRILDRVFVEIEDDVLHARIPELLRHAATDPAVATDDVVVAELLDRPSPPSFGQCAREDAARNPFDEDRGDERKDSQSGEDERNRDQPCRVVRRHGVEPGQRARDDGAVERLDPPFVGCVVEGDRSRDDDHRRGAQGVSDPPRREGVVHGYIVGAWRTTTSSDS
jgi:hypothetical protein